MHCVTGEFRKLPPRIANFPFREPEQTNVLVRLCIAVTFDVRYTGGTGITLAKMASKFYLPLGSTKFTQWYYLITR